MAVMWERDDMEAASDTDELLRLSDSRTSSKPSIDISRERLNELKFEGGFSRQPKSLDLKERLKLLLPPEPIRSALVPPLSLQAWLNFVLIHVPIVRWVWMYQLRFFIGDVIAGITVAIMHIPQGLAYALLANLAPVYGLYTSFMPPIIYSILGTSRHLSVGTFAVVQLMIGNSIENIFHSNSKYNPCLSEGGNGNNSNTSIVISESELNGTAIDCDVEKVRIAIAIAFVSGVIMLLMGVAQLGFITIFLSESLVSGYTTGAAVHVFSSQLTHILGINNRVLPGFFQVPRLWIKSLSILTHTNWVTLLVSIAAITALILFKVANKYLQRLHVCVPCYSTRRHMWGRKTIKWSVPIPSQLVVVVIFTLISYTADLENRSHVIIVGEIPKGAPPVSNPFNEYFATVFKDSFVIAIVTYSVSISLSQLFARKFDYSIHSNQEFIAYGAVNIVSSFFSSFTASGSLSRSVIQANTGGKTQLVGFISSGIILVVLLWLGSLFTALPRAVLASIVWVALYGLFTQFADLWRYFKLSFSDTLIWLVVFLATVLLGVDMGLGVGVTFSLLIIIVRTILPASSILGQAKNTELFRNQEFFEVETIPGVLIFRFMAPVCFINAVVFRRRLEMASDLHKRHKPGGDEKGCLEKMLPPPETCLNEVRMRHCCRAEQKTNGSHIKEEEKREEGGAEGTHRSFQMSNISDRDLRVPPTPKPQQLVHTVIIDCAPIGFLDAVGVKALRQIVLDFDKCDIQVLFAGMTALNRGMLERAQFYTICGKEWLFPSLQDAVHHAQYGSKLRPNGQEEVLFQDKGEEEGRGGGGRGEVEEGREGGREEGAEGGGGGEGGRGGGGGGVTVVGEESQL